MGPPRQSASLTLCHPDVLPPRRCATRHISSLLFIHFATTDVLPPYSLPPRYFATNSVGYRTTRSCRQKALLSRRGPASIEKDLQGRRDNLVVGQWCRITKLSYTTSYSKGNHALGPASLFLLGLAHTLSVGPFANSSELS